MSKNIAMVDRKVKSGDNITRSLSTKSLFRAKSFTHKLFIGSIICLMVS